MNESIFELILKKEIPGFIIYEDDNFFGLLDVNPKQNGHTLLITKAKKQSILHEDQETLKNYLVVANKVSKILKEKLGANGFRYQFNSEKIAGQEVMHTHLHIIPYYDNGEEIIDVKKIWDKITK